MEKYILGRSLGEGTYGSVQSAYNSSTGDRVAIKTLKEKCMTISAMTRLPEIQALRRLSHPNIVECKECILDKRSVHIVFELMTDGDLVQFSKVQAENLSERQIAGIAYQILAALAYVHASNFLHRDIKPENILLSHPVGNGDAHQSHKYQTPTVKIADFGLAKELAVDQHSMRPHTAYVATRWYRAPEQLLRIPKYGAAADIWAAGATIAELLSGGVPLFPGDTEIETLSSVFALRGHPALIGWPAGASASARVAPSLARTVPSDLAGAFRGASPAVLQLLDDLLQLNPANRPSAARALEYPLFQLYCPQDNEERENPVEYSTKRQRLSTAVLSSRVGTPETGAGLGNLRATSPPHQTFSPISMQRPRCTSMDDKGVGTIKKDNNQFFDIPRQDEGNQRTTQRGSRSLRHPAGNFDIRRKKQDRNTLESNRGAISRWDFPSP